MSQAFRILILCSFSILLTLQFNPSLQKGYFSIKPNSSFSYEFPQTRNGTLAHYFDYSGPSGSDSRYVFFDLISGDAYPILSQTAQACQIRTPIFQHLHYHVATDNLVYYCAQNSSLLFINQADHTVQSSVYLNINNTLPIAKLTSYGMYVDILAMDSLFTSNPQSSILVKVDMQSREVITQFVFNQNLTTGESVVAYDTNYIATNNWQNNSLITKIYQFNAIGTSYSLFPIVNFTSSTQTMTKFFVIDGYLIVTVDATVLFLNFMGTMVQLANIHTKELTAGIFHPAVVLSTEGDSLYLHTNSLAIVKYTIVASGIFMKNLGNSQDMQIAHANYTSNDLMFTYDPSGVFFNISDLKTKKNLRTSILSYNDLMLTNTTYTVVQNNAFYTFDLKTDSLINHVSIPQSKYYYNKDQHIVTYLRAPLNSSCEVTHLDLVSGKSWKTLDLAANLCPGDVSYARVTEKGSAELVIPATQSSFLIISETYRQIVFNTSSLTHDTDSININFDDLSFYYYMSNQALKLINAYYYTFDPQSKQFQINDTKPLKARPVESNGLFTVNQNLTVGLSEATFTIINQIDTQWFKIYANEFNLVTGFEDQSGTPHMFFSYVSNSSLYPILCGPMIYSNDGAEISIPQKRASTTSGQATGPGSFALYDMIYTSVSVVRFFNSDPQASKTLISI